MKFLRKLRIAWAYLGMRDWPDGSFRIGPKRAWQIAGIILEAQSDFRVSSEEATNENQN